MRNIEICKKCPYFGQACGVLMCVSQETIELCKTNNGVETLLCNIAANEQEYANLKLFDECKFYTEQYISECANGHKKQTV